MCRPASFVVTKSNVFFNPPELGESHLVIMKRNHIVNDEHEIHGVAVEITPPDFDFSLSFDKWVFKVDQDLLPDWWNKEEAEIACREKLPEWFEAHCVKEDIVIGSGLYFVMEGSPNIIMCGGVCLIFSDFSPNIIVNKDGVCRTLGDSSPNITVNEGGMCVTYDNSKPTVTVNEGGYCRTFDNSKPNIMVNEGGECETFNNSIPIITVNEGGCCETFGYSSPNVTINKSGHCGTYGNSSPMIIANKGGKCETHGNSLPVIKVNDGGYYKKYD